MCPACLASWALIAASTTATGGVAAFVLRKLHLKSRAAKSAAPSTSSKRTLNEHRL
jgi:hypothetical protein